MGKPQRVMGYGAAPIGVLLAALCTRVSTVSIYRNSKVIELDVNNFWRYTGNVSAGEVSVVEVSARRRWVRGMCGSRAQRQPAA